MRSNGWQPRIWQTNRKLKQRPPCLRRITPSVQYSRKGLFITARLLRPAMPASGNSQCTLPVILVDSEIVVYKVSSGQIFYKLFVVCNNHKLKVSLLPPGSYDSIPKKEMKS